MGMYAPKLMLIALLLSMMGPMVSLRPCLCGFNDAYVWSPAACERA